jgi:hypothetical protein
LARIQEEGDSKLRSFQPRKRFGQVGRKRALEKFGWRTVALQDRIRTRRGKVPAAFNSATAPHRQDDSQATPPGRIAINRKNRKTVMDALSGLTKSPFACVSRTFAESAQQVLTIFLRETLT